MSEQENINTKAGEKVEDEGANNNDNGLQPPQPQEKPSPQAAEIKKTPVKRTPSKRMSFIERAQKESEELVKNMGGSLELEGGRRTRSSTRGTPSRTPVQATPPPAKKARNTPVSSGGSNSGTPTPKARGRARRLNIISPSKTPEIEDEVNTKTEEEVDAEIVGEVKNSAALVDNTVKATECKESAIPAVKSKAVDEKENAKAVEIETKVAESSKVAESAKVEKVAVAASSEKSTTVKEASSVIDGVTLSVSKTVPEPESKVEDTIKSTDSAKLVKSVADNKIESKDEIHSSTDEKKDNAVPVVITKEVCTKKTLNHLQTEETAAEPPESVMEVDETPDIVTESEAPKNAVTSAVQGKVEVPIAIITNEESSVEKLHIIDENGTDFASETTNEIPEPMEVDAAPNQQHQQQKQQQQSQNLPSSLVTIKDASDKNDEVKKVVENNVTATATAAVAVAKDRVKSPIDRSLSEKDAINESFERGAKQENDLQIKLKTKTTGDLGEKVVANVNNESKKANDYCEPQIAISPSIATANDEGVSTPQFCN